MFCREPRTGRQLDSMGINKAGGGSDELEFPGSKLLCAAIGELLDQRILPRHDFSEIEGDFTANAPWLRMAGKMQHFRGVQQGFGGHAAAQDAQAADFFATLNNNGLESGG